ncbi:hypothetical protein [Salinarimonas chemoclinalis]|uniref:hypothetical protein n=1 Tax=Salinarimonas chemoclinalis TaxID=3241599 RepID=UPI0035560348
MRRHGSKASFRQQSLMPARAARQGWLDAGSSSLVELRQRYRLLDAFRYDYAAPSVPCSEISRLSPSGFVETYPGLWVSEASAETVSAVRGAAGGRTPNGA